MIVVNKKYPRVSTLICFTQRKKAFWI